MGTSMSGFYLQDYVISSVKTDYMDHLKNKIRKVCGEILIQMQKHMNTNDMCRAMMNGLHNDCNQ
jgi:hypothetical protein